MGDGTNDTPTLKEAGTDVACHTKPKAQANADACIGSGGLGRVRDWLR